MSYSPFLACNEVHNSTFGSFKSPNFPNKYTNNANCHYLIMNSDSTTRIMLHFLHFDLESHMSCKYDSVAIYDGNSNNASQIGRTYGYCGKRAPPKLTIASTGNSVLIVFVSDGSVTTSGFNATYRGRTILIFFIPIMSFTIQALIVPVL